MFPKLVTDVLIDKPISLAPQPEVVLHITNQSEHGLRKYSKFRVFNTP